MTSNFTLLLAGDGEKKSNLFLLLFSAERFYRLAGCLGANVGISWELFLGHGFWIDLMSEHLHSTYLDIIFVQISYCDANYSA